MQNLFDEIARFISSLNVDDYIGLSSVVVALVAVIVSFSSLKLAKTALSITSSRDSAREAGILANRMREIIANSKVDSLRFSKNSKLTDRKIHIFEKKNLDILTELNILSSSFTKTGRLAEEKLAYASVGYLLCNFLNQSIEAIQFIYKTSGRYGDLCLIYKLWEMRDRIDKSRRRLNDSEKISIDTQKRIIYLSLDLIKRYLATLYQYHMKKSDEAKERQLVIKTKMQELINVNKEYRRSIKEQKELLKKQRANERYFEKKIEKNLQPLGVNS